MVVSSVFLAHSTVTNLYFLMCPHISLFLSLSVCLSVCLSLSRLKKYIYNYVFAYYLSIHASPSSMAFVTFSLSLYLSPLSFLSLSASLSFFSLSLPLYFSFFLSPSFPLFSLLHIPHVTIKI